MTAIGHESKTMGIVVESEGNCTYGVALNL